MSFEDGQCLAPCRTRISDRAEAYSKHLLLWLIERNIERTPTHIALEKKSLSSEHISVRVVMHQPTSISAYHMGLHHGWERKEEEIPL